ncbi:MAG: hypothetical protein KGJ24_05080 [Burkholderiales bacterium]|nr:hypothetical protein [Burkholderiales bacterium]
MLCAADPAAWGNAAGLLGTAALAIGSVAAIPVARRLYRVSRALTVLNEQRRQEAAAMPAAQDPDLKDVDPAKLQRALARLQQHSEALREALDESQAQLALKKDRWTGWNTAVLAAGLVLTLASDALPLWLPRCAEPMAGPVAGTVPPPSR